MSWAYAVAVTFGLVMVDYAILAFLTQMQVPKGVLSILEMLLGAVLILGSAYWVAQDSERVEINKYEGIVQGSPAGLAVVTVLLWPLVFPAYMQKRWMIKNRRLSIKPEFHPNYRKPEQK